MRRTSPPLTVGMPVYNGENYVAEAIESVLAQTYSDFDLIISDNASTDATEEICRSYAAGDHRIVFRRLTENVGAAANFNRVFQMAKSPFFKFAAHDDLCMPRFFEVCMNAFTDASPEVALCFPGTIRIDSTGHRQGLLEERLDLRDPEPHRRFRAYLSGYNLSNPYYGVLRSSAYGATRMLQPFVAADMVLIGELALQGQLWQLSEPLFLRRFHSKMSAEAAKTLGDLTRYYDTGHSGQTVLYRSKLLHEFFRAIAFAPLSPYQRMRCRQALLTSWLPRRSFAITRELTRQAYVSLSRSIRT